MRKPFRLALNFTRALACIFIGFVLLVGGEDTPEREDDPQFLNYGPSMPIRGLYLSGGIDTSSLQLCDQTTGECRINFIKSYEVRFSETASGQLQNLKGAGAREPFSFEMVLLQGVGRLNGHDNSSGHLESEYCQVLLTEVTAICEKWQHLVFHYAPPDDIPSPASGTKFND